MKRFYLLLLFSTFISVCAQQTTLQVVGKNLTTVSGQTIILRGINYPIIDDGTISLANMTEYRHKIDQAALTGANAIRLSWYTDGTHWRDKNTPGTVAGYLTNGNLSDLIGYCYAKGMIPILDIHNLTCSNDWASFNLAAMAWWKSPAVLDLIKRHKEYLVINLANEFGYVRWADDPIGALNTFQTNYKNAIAEMRALGIKVPIAIDAPDCGQSSTELLSIAKNMVDFDPLHNLIFSAHAYWSDYASTPKQIEAKLDEAQNTNVCFILGEIANTQDGNSCGSISLASIYPIILQQACSRNIGWLAWTYDQDCDSGRELTVNGEFNTLTVYGKDIVNNFKYGLKSRRGCGAKALAVTGFDYENTFTIWPNPVQNMLSVSHPEKISKVVLFDLKGKKLKEFNSGFTAIDLSFLSAGQYLMQLETLDNQTVSKKLVKN